MAQLVDDLKSLQMASDKAVVDDSSLPPADVDSMFADAEADVTFCSSDGVHYQLQRKFLEANTGAFPGSEFDTRGEIVHLTEPSRVLRILFGFVHPRRHPDIEELEFKALSEVAEAAEKYEVFSAIDVCKMQMRRFIKNNPIEILAHATRHGHTKLIEEVAPHLARVSTATVIEQLPPRFVIPWLNYRKAWDAIFDDTMTEILTSGVARPSGRPTYAYFASSLQPEACYACKIAMLTAIHEWKLISSVEELKETLTKPRPRLMQCLAPSCQYSTVFAKVCEDMKTKMDALSTFSLSPSLDKY